jgi:RNA polymerase sigma-70 factor, ECF subfamily
MENSEIEVRLERARRGDRGAVSELLEGQRDRLRRVVDLRLDRRLRPRVDPSDVVQDSFLEASRRFDEYLRRPSMPFHLWVRFLTVQRIETLYREHLEAQRRNVRREVRLDGRSGSGSHSAASSEVVAAHLLGKRTSPSRAAARAEILARVREALESMDAADREVIALRHFEQLDNAEVALVLHLEESAASKRYIRAIKRLRGLLAGLSGLSDSAWG